MFNAKLIGAVAITAAAISFVSQKPALAAATYNWTGPYIGLVTGYVWGHAEQTYDVSPYSAFSIVPQNPSGGFIGIEGGANYQFSSDWVIGIDADAALDGAKDTVPDYLGAYVYTTDEYTTVKTDWDANIRARVGYAFGRTLLFGTGGISFAHTIVQDTANSYEDSATLAGWNIGVGIQEALSEHVSARLEYQYTSLGSHTWFPDQPFSSTGSASASAIRLGLDYKF